MFYFDLNDEAWKGGDDNWGLYEQGDENKIGDASGNPKFRPTNVNEILEANLDDLLEPASLEAPSCITSMVQRRRRDQNMCYCRRRSGNSDLSVGWTCKDNAIEMTTAAVR